MITVKNIHNKIIIAHCLLTNKKYNFHIHYSFHIIFEKKERNAIPIPVLKILINT